MLVFVISYWFPKTKFKWFHWIHELNWAYFIDKYQKDWTQVLQLKLSSPNNTHTVFISGTCNVSYLQSDDRLCNNLRSWDPLPCSLGISQRDLRLCKKIKIYYTESVMCYMYSISLHVHQNKRILDIPVFFWNLTVWCLLFHIPVVWYKRTGSRNKECALKKDFTVYLQFMDDCLDTLLIHVQLQPCPCTVTRNLHKDWFWS